MFVCGILTLLRQDTGDWFPAPLVVLLPSPAKMKQPRAPGLGWQMHAHNNSLEKRIRGGNAVSSPYNTCYHSEVPGLQKQSLPPI